MITLTMESSFLSLISVNLSLLLGAIMLFIMFCKTKFTRRHNLPPGPTYLQALRAILQRGNLVLQAKAWSRQYGEVVLCRSPLGDMYFLNSARLVKKLYVSKELEQLSNFRPASFVGWYAFYNYRDVATSSSYLNPEWSKMRKLFHQALKFYGDGVDRMESLIQTELRRLVTELEAKGGQDMDIHDIVSNSILRVVICLVMGEIPEQSVVDLAKRMDLLFNQLLDPFTDNVLTTLPWLRFIPILPYRKLCQDVRKSREAFMKESFDKAKATFIPGQPRGIADVLFEEQRKEENLWLTDDHVRGLFVDIVGAAHVTSTQTIMAIFFYLIHNPEIMQEMQKEIDLNLGKQTPRLQDRSNLPFADAVILETLRIASPVPFGLPHQIGENLELDGYTLPAGAKILANSQVFQLDPEVYQDPDVFRPDRFLDETGHLLQATHPLRQSLLPFGIGKRSCPGESFAKSRIFLYVTTLLQKFDILPPAKDRLPPLDSSSFESSGIVYLLKPYHLVFRKRV